MKSRSEPLDSLDQNENLEGIYTARSKSGYYKKLLRNLVVLCLFFSLVPLVLVGWWINHYYSQFAKERVQKSLENRVNHHKKMIELFLESRKSNLNTIARTHSQDHLQKQDNLQHALTILNKEYEESFTDLGIIDDQGDHLAYIGPYDLLSKNYSKAYWFQEVMKKGVYLSDIFMGFRKSPHFIIAITSRENKDKWILRATIDSESFRSLVENLPIGRTGEIYLVNEQGILQTTPRFQGKIMDQDPYQVPVSPHPGIKIQTIQSPDQEEKGSQKQIVATSWLNKPHWMMVVKQNYSEAYREVFQTKWTTLTSLLVSALIILIVVLLITLNMIKVIKKRDQESEQLNRQLLQAGKLAAVGELSAGVAHEINNPLGIILTEKQILQDTAKQYPDLAGKFLEQLQQSTEQISEQVKRCRHLTQNLLRFARRTESKIEPVDMNSFLAEIVDLMDREARSGGIKFMTDFDDSLPRIKSDSSQLQQVFLNLIKNAIDAHAGMAYGSIYLRTRLNKDKQNIVIEVEDTGCGISKENLDKIFDPFFTTKPVGKGTGLGLSICYGIVKRLAGEIHVHSQPGKGTIFRIILPLEPS